MGVSEAELKDKIAVVGESTVGTGFKLSGVEDVFLVSSDEEAERKISQLLGDPSYGIIIVSERAFEKFDWRLKKRIEAAAKPVVITIPDRRGPMEQAESLQKLIRRALGFDLMAKK